MEAVAGWTSDEGPSARSSGVSGEPDLLAQVAALACRAIGVQTAVVLLRDPPSGGGGLREVARHGLTRRRMRVAVRCPIVVDGDVRGVLAVVGTRRLEPDQLELLGELADLAATSLEERDRRSHAEAIVTAGVDVLARAVDMRDDYTGRHSAHVGELARKVGERLGMPAGDIALLEFAARLHDLGKLAVPDTILQKPGPLDEDEWAVMRRHPEWGAEMVSSVPGLEQLGLLVASHHERWDGSGYPDGLAGESIPLASRVISVCDAYEAMVSRRPYRASLSVQSALGELSAGAGSQFDPVVVAAVVAEIAT
jgi:HD-GYP domain-containing protein (c-di-GMP phosphodiesterase class II)